MFGKHGTPAKVDPVTEGIISRTVEYIKLDIPPARYLAVVVCDMTETNALYEELSLAAHGRAWNVGMYKLNIQTMTGLIPVDLIGDLAYDQFAIDMRNFPRSKGVVHFHIS